MWGACMAGGHVCIAGGIHEGVHGRGVHGRGHAWMGVCVARGYAWPGGCVHGKRDGHYWNALLWINDNISIFHHTTMI